ncbi:MAG: hypothetical protein MUE36_06595 [Acidimicrobiales bacterium]|jgi:hypothetical protein|nr:hypothetical protein [Acidimicrobiales bacterium]
MSRFASLSRRWGFALVWVTLPFAAGPSFAEALDPRSRPVQLVASIGLWALWALTLAAGLVPRPVSLTTIRIVAPAAVLGAMWAAVAGPDGVALTASLALAVTSLAAVVSMFAPVGDEFVNGSSYGDERRMLLRPPGVVILGPMESVWLLVVTGAVAGPLLLAAEQWIAGGIVLVVGWAVAAVGARNLHQLVLRWIVFVPAGFVLVDRTVLHDAFLVQRSHLRSLAPAPADTASRDLTAGALGLALEAVFVESETIVPAGTRRLRGEPDPITVEGVAGVLFTPSRPGAVLAEAARRRLPGT